MSWQRFHNSWQYSEPDDYGRAAPLPTAAIRTRLKPEQKILVLVTSDIARSTWRRAGYLDFRSSTAGHTYTAFSHPIGLNSGPYLYQTPSDLTGFQFTPMRWIIEYNLTMWKWIGKTPPPPTITDGDGTLEVKDGILKIPL